MSKAKMFTIDTTRLLEVMKSKGWNRKRLAESLMLDYQSFCKRIKNGKLSHSDLYAIAHVLDVNPDFLKGEEDTFPTYSHYLQWENLKKKETIIKDLFSLLGIPEECYYIIDEYGNVDELLNDIRDIVVWDHISKAQLKRKQKTKGSASAEEEEAMMRDFIQKFLAGKPKK